MDELIQVVDDNDEPIRGASVNDVYKHGLRHRVVYALIRDKNGRLLVQHRGPEAGSYQGYWGASAAGYAYENERYDVAVMRKLAEELGLSNLELREVDSFNSELENDRGAAKQVNKVFESGVPADAELHIDPTKIAELRWLDEQELQRMLQDEPDTITPGLREVIIRYL